VNGALSFGLLFALTAALVPAGVHLGFRARHVRETGTPAGYGLVFEAVRIPTVRGRHLVGWLIPAPDAARIVVVLHGWGSNAEQMLPIAAPLRRAGLNVLLVDARNHGGSDPDTFSSMPRFAEDLGQAIAWLKRYHPGRAEQIAVLGHSVGAGARKQSFALASKDNRPSGCICEPRRVLGRAASGVSAERAGEVRWIGIADIPADGR
jgi:pimeloyl-ACP methyl ester carboxylesterase